MKSLSLYSASLAHVPNNAAASELSQLHCCCRLVEVGQVIAAVAAAVDTAERQPVARDLVLGPTD